MNPADELAMVRVQIARLKTRERALRAALVADARGREGRWTRAEVVQRPVRVFDHRRLPAAIRDDPAYWSERPMVEVLCHEIEGRGLQHPPGRVQVSAATLQ